VGAAVKAHPDRLIGCARIDPRQTEASKDEIRRTAEQHGFPGIALHPAEQGFKINDPLVLPVIALASELGLFVHVEIGYPILSTPMQVAQLARLFPSTPFVLAHMGSDSYFGDALGAGTLYSNLYLETSGHVLTGEAKNGIRMAIDALGAERILFATDTPYFEVKIELLRIEVANLSQDEQALILGGNCLRLVGRETLA
jgi:predicted TIM-barrel fold metal-dependent hydrolase